MEEEKKGSYEQDVRESLTGPINLSDLRISMPERSNEIKDSLIFFESLLKESYGEFRFRKAIQIIEEFPGDIYNEREAGKLITKLAGKELFGSSDTA